VYRADGLPGIQGSGVDRADRGVSSVIIGLGHQQGEAAIWLDWCGKVDSPEETRSFGDGAGKLELVNLQGGPVGRATFEPGWQWPKHVKPIAKTDGCQAAHMGCVVSGRMKIVMDDGQESEFGPGDFMVCPPGHDARIVGDERCVVIDWQGVADYAKR
jgi:quercetin dioxygenase-like cupin family protein